MPKTRPASSRSPVIAGVFADFIGSLSSLVRGTRAFAALIVVLLAPLLLAARNTGSGSIDTSEDALKAAWLYKFATYTKWPERAFEKPDSPLIVAVVGADPFGRVLDEAFKDKKVGGRAVQVTRFKTAADVGKCHILFVTAQETPKLAKILETIGKDPVLVVGESPGIATKGAAINFYIEDKRMHFEINVDTARRALLEISSELLKLARIVKNEEGGK